MENIFARIFLIVLACEILVMDSGYLIKLDLEINIYPNRLLNA